MVSFPWIPDSTDFTLTFGTGAMTGSLQVLGGALSGMSAGMTVMIQGFVPAVGAQLAGAAGELASSLGGSFAMGAAGASSGSTCQ